MKRYYRSIAMLFFFVQAVLLWGQNRLTADLEAFETLSVSGGIDVEIIPSNSHQMSITARDGRPEEVKYEISNGELSIRVRPDFNKDDEVRVRLPYKKLTRIHASSGAVINSREDFKGDLLELRATSGGKIELSLEVNALEARVTQFSDIILYGTAVIQHVHAGSGGNYLAFDLECDETHVQSRAGAQAKVVARKSIDASAGSKGYIAYIGSPANTSVETSLGGEVRAFNSVEEVGRE